MTPYVKSAVKKQLKSNPMLAGYQMGKVSDKEHARKKAVRKRK